MGDTQGKMIMCGNFNAHNCLCSKNTDNNGEIIEAFIEELSQVCSSSCLDHVCSIESVYEEYIDSDHWPVICDIQKVVQKLNIGENGKEIEECTVAIEK